ncbi:MAG: 6-phosphogluconolactonase [Deltaproteobacteria bacterium]|nr:6-phosphogluconolactonase [Deltaproteobacteria bacterium]
MIPQKGEIRIAASTGEFYREAAEEFTRLSREAVDREGHFTVALSGGTTPAGLYELLADQADTFRNNIPWGGIHFFFGDERHVGPDHPASNYRMAQTSLLSKVPVLESNLHRIEAESPDPDRAARNYEEVLKKIFQLKSGEMPRFDLVLLGMGADGHTASLFPNTNVLRERERLVAAVRVAKSGACRITLTPPVFCSAACVIILVSGEEKAETLLSVLQGDFLPDRFPVQLIRPTEGRLLWIVDSQAARLLNIEGEEKKRGN